MIPILYPPGTEDFSNNGLGELYDCIEAVGEEERNGKLEIRFVYPVDGVHYDEIHTSSLVKAVHADGEEPQIFEIYYSSKPINGKVEFKAQHESYRLSSIPVMPFSATNPVQALQNIKDYAVEACPYEFWTDKVSVGSMNLKVPMSARSILGGTAGSILDSFGGGEYKFDGRTVKLYQNRGADRGVTLRYGKNITDITQEKNIAETVTGIVPFWAGEGENGNILVTLQEKAVYCQNAERFPYQHTAVLDCGNHFQEMPTEAQLREYATSYINQIGMGIPKVSIKVSFVPLWQSDEYKDIANLERVRLCDTVTVEFEPLGISAAAKVVKTEYDILKERYISIELGDARTNLAGAVKADIGNATDAVKRTAITRSFLEQEIDRATELIRGGLGGYVVFTLNADGEPQEITIMDTDDIQTAVQCIRINRNGIGFSTTGYDGTYTSAWTIDGRFNADFIATGTLAATLIKGGVLRMGGINNGNGVIEVYNGNNVLVGKWDKDGLTASGDLQMIKNNLNSGLGTAKFIYYMQAEGRIRWDDKTGFYSKLLNGNDIVSSYSVFPESTDVTEQIYAGNAWRKTFCFAEDGMTEGMIYFLIGSKQGFRMFNYGYGNADNTGLLDFTINPTVGFVADCGGVSLEASSSEIDLESDNWEVSSKTSGVNIRGGTSEIQVNSNSYGTNGIYAKGGERSELAIINAYNENPTISMRSGASSGNHVEFRATYGVYHEGDVTYTGAAYINGSQLAFSSSSSRRYKHDIKDLEDGTLDPHKLLSLPVRQFVYNDDVPCQYNDMHRLTIPGFIAEEVAEIYPSAVIHRDKDGAIESWDERRIIPGMLALIQEQEKRIQTLEERLKKIEELLT